MQKLFITKLQKIIQRQWEVLSDNNFHSSTWDETIYRRAELNKRWSASRVVVDDKKTSADRVPTFHFGLGIGCGDKKITGNGKRLRNRQSRWRKKKKNFLIVNEVGELEFESLLETVTTTRLAEEICANWSSFSSSLEQHAVAADDCPRRGRKLCKPRTFEIEVISSWAITLRAQSDRNDREPMIMIIKSTLRSSLLAPSQHSDRSQFLFKLSNWITSD